MSYRISVEDDIVTICKGKDCDLLDGFLDIYVKDKDIDSPFKSVDDAKLFAEIIIKLLGVIT